MAKLTTADLADIKVKIERSSREEHGDFSCAIALQIAGKTGLPAEQVARLLLQDAAEDLSQIADCKINGGGFINFRLHDHVLKEQLCLLHARSSPAEPAGKTDPALTKALRNEQATLCGEASENNIEFFVQYMHARCSSYLRLALQPVLNTLTLSTGEAFVSGKEWQRWLQEYRLCAEVFAPLFEEDDGSLPAQRQLSLELIYGIETESESLAELSNHQLRIYALELARKIEHFLDKSRLFTCAESITRARLGLLLAAKQTLASRLALLAIPAPDSI